MEKISEDARLEICFEDCRALGLEEHNKAVALNDDNVSIDMVRAGNLFLSRFIFPHCTAYEETDLKFPLLSRIA